MCYLQKKRNKKTQEMDPQKSTYIAHCGQYWEMWTYQIAPPCYKCLYIPEVRDMNMECDRPTERNSIDCFSLMVTIGKSTKNIHKFQNFKICISKTIWFLASIMSLNYLTNYFVLILLGTTNAFYQTLQIQFLFSII